MLVAVALIGIAAYMIVVGWNQATAIATIGAFFLAAIGVAVAVADRRSEGSEVRGGVTMRKRKVDAGGSVGQVADVRPDDKASLDMSQVTARSGDVEQRARVVNWPRLPGARRRGDRHG